MVATAKDEGALLMARRARNVPWCEPFERMISGMAYESWSSPELIEARARSLMLCGQFNGVHLLSNGQVMLQGRTSILKDLLAESHETTNIEPPFSVLYGCNTRIGKNFYGNVNLALDDSGFITIGDNVLIGPDVHFITINHPTDVEERLKGVMYTRPIVVESACWIGARATLLPGAHVGYGCTIGAGAVVHGEIPDYSVAAGVPAKVVRRVFPREGPGAEQADRSMA